MSLIKKWMLAIFVTLLLLMVGTFALIINNGRHFFIEQMNSNAQDTATSLGLSLTQALAEKDSAMMLSMVEAVFDNGYFAMIEVRDFKGELLVSRYAPKRLDKAPVWFVDLVQWPSLVQSAVIMSGWKQIGEVLVTTDTQYACLALWRNALHLLTWYLLFLVLALFITYQWLVRLLNPLTRIIDQATQISRGRWQTEPFIPKIRELKNLTLIMNAIANAMRSNTQEQWQKMERLRGQWFQDPLTQMGNKHFFLQFFSSLQKSGEHFTPWFVLLSTVDGVSSKIKTEDDALILEYAQALNDFWKDNAFATICRTGHFEFAVIIVHPNEAWVQEQCEYFLCYLEKRALQPMLLVLGSCDEQEPGDVLLNSLRPRLSKMLEQPLPSSRGREQCLKALHAGDWVLHSQKIQLNEILFHEYFFVTLRTSNKHELHSGYFMPFAEQAGIAGLADVWVLEAVIKKQRFLENAVAINISHAILHDDTREAMLQMLALLPLKVRDNIHLELDECIVMHHFLIVMNFSQALQKLQIKMGITRLRIHFHPSDYFQQLPWYYLKIHKSWLQSDSCHQGNNPFLESYFQEIARILNSTLINDESQRYVSQYP